mmetsp:Transcript_33212/g.93107  ORF Transcript_33212/g.93107 Transcript_33212/m.93107 type:complete len:736 (+) Transcript_33212:146-2353(+)|eukprot:CAMPEP_0119125316 /NCGR_PEP_ID=MMETSP1310-20130426/4635_1 /TAXON_ID=464262 /ORGANISM="Genus nov. species nov., Strain RCC2339" /LENGTH=735 /DNA_ID=CAMNT_0007115373 /DNA_START=135 /DNA_END=2342 /DNA_ORIENTATION=-
MGKKVATVALTVSSVPEACTDLALANIIPISTPDFAKLGSSYIEIMGYVYSVRAHKAVTEGQMGINAIQRRAMSLAIKQSVVVKSFHTDKDMLLHTVNIELDFLNQNHVTTEPFDTNSMTKAMSLFHTQVFSKGQRFLLDVHGTRMIAKVIAMQTLSVNNLKRKSGDAVVDATQGVLMESTSCLFSKAQGSRLVIKGGGSSGSQPGIIRADFDFENIGIGGMDKEFMEIFRRAFSSRFFSPSIMEKMGIKHVKGILLYGPPGTGKTLMARQIGKMLNTREPKIVLGPEILNKYVGQSEENIRELFREAEEEYQLHGNESQLHIIIFDEIDSICRARGSVGGTGVADTVVNQLLSKIDGVQSLNNILIIGMTNRKDMIDEALLRPGRLEVHMEISLPNEEGRLQIFKIHTAKMRENNYMAEDVSLEEMAKMTKNYTGAEIEAVVKSASSFALFRQVDLKNMRVQLTELSSPVTRADFVQALEENQPAFGMTSDEFENCAPNGIIDFGPEFVKLRQTIEMFVQQVENSDKTPLVSVLLEGRTGSGKTALAATIAQKSQFPYVKLIAPEKMVGLSEAGKCAKIAKIFADCYKSPLSLIVIDNIERLIEFVPQGPRFSNTLLQTLLILIKKVPPKGRKLLVVGTTSSLYVMDKLDMTPAFNAVLHQPDVKSGEEVATVLESLSYFTPKDVKCCAPAIHKEIPVKRLLLISDLAKQSISKDESLPIRFVECLESFAGGNM